MFSNNQIQILSDTRKLMQKVDDEIVRLAVANYVNQPSQIYMVKLLREAADKLEGYPIHEYR